MTTQNQRPVALVTGGGRRVGRAIALCLAGKGYDIALTCNTSRREADETCEQITRLGAAASVIHADLRQLPQAAEHITAELTRFRPRVDAIIHNASLYKPDRDMEHMEDFWRLHVEAPLLLSRILLPMLKQTHGGIVTLCDILADRPMVGWLGYCASKAALASLTRGLAKEFAPEVRVNGIAPGVAQWPDDMPDDQRQQYLKRVPLARAGTPEEIARLVHFLLEQGTYLTGQIINIDGGRSIA